LPIYIPPMLHTNLPAGASMVGCLNPAVQGIHSHPTHLKHEIWQEIVVANLQLLTD